MNVLSTSDRNIFNAFVTPEDLKDAKLFTGKLVFLVKTGENTKIEYPRINEGNMTELRISAEGGSIDVLHIKTQND
jgi:hypothetical protein